MLNREQVQEILSKALVELFEIDPSKITLTANLYEDLEIDTASMPSILSTISSARRAIAWWPMISARSARWVMWSKPS